MKEKVKEFPITINRSIKNLDIPSMIVSQVIQHISDGTLQPGDKLPSELEMTRRYKVSRISLREALKILEAKGYIESQGRQGKFVKSIVENGVKTPIADLLSSDDNNLVHFIEVNKMIAGETAYIAASRAQDDDITEMKSIINDARNIASTEERIAEKRIEKYLKFHKSLSDCTKNVFFSHMNGSLSSAIKLMLQDKTANLLSKEDLANQIFTQLEEVTNAMEKRSADDARRAMQQHTDYLKRSFAK